MSPGTGGPVSVSSKPTKLLLLLTLAVCLSAAVWYLRQPDGRKPARLSGATMGTTWSVVLGTKSAGADPAALQLLLQQQLDLINKQMSTYDPTSEVSRFNDSSSTNWFPVSAETALVVELAQEISRISDGAFDITVGPLVDLWGFGPKPRSENVHLTVRLLLHAGWWGTGICRCAAFLLLCARIFRA